VTDTTGRTLTEKQRRRLAELRVAGHLALAVLTLEERVLELTMKVAALEKKPKP
jgi:hypothetical protein